MSFRDWANRNPAIVGGIVLVAVAVAVYVCWPASPPPTSTSAKLFYTDDDGATWFVDSAMRVAPFDHNGKQALRAHVFRCMKDRKLSVEFVERYTENAKRVLEAYRKVKPGEPSGLSSEQLNKAYAGREIRKRGESKWVDFEQARGLIVALGLGEAKTEIQPEE